MNRHGTRAIDCSPSLELQFLVKKESGHRDIMISYSHTCQAFALKLRHSLEDHFFTTWMDLMDHKYHSGIGGGMIWREELASGIQNASVVVCILTATYPQSHWCMKELAFAKENNVPGRNISVSIYLSFYLSIYLSI